MRRVPRAEFHGDPLQGRVPHGHQPEVVVITPSRSQPWYGGWAEGARFTGLQLAALRRAGLDPAAVDTITAYREATTREMWWPTNALPPVFSFDCPVTWRGEHKVRAIAPDGSAQLIRSDGWIGSVTRRGW